MSDIESVEGDIYFPTESQLPSFSNCRNQQKSFSSVLRKINSDPFDVSSSLGVHLIQPRDVILECLNNIVHSVPSVPGKQYTTFHSLLSTLTTAACVSAVRQILSSRMWYIPLAKSRFHTVLLKQMKSNIFSFVEFGNVKSRRNLDLLRNNPRDLVFIITGLPQDIESYRHSKGERDPPFLINVPFVLATLDDQNSLRVNVELISALMAELNLGSDSCLAAIPLNTIADALKLQARSIAFLSPKKDTKTTYRQSLLDQLMGKKLTCTTPSSFLSEFQFYNALADPAKKLTSTQRKCLELYMKMSNGILCVHGPPGTGKSTVLGSMASLAVKAKRKVLICAGTNTAVANCAEVFMDERKKQILFVDMKREELLLRGRLNRYNLPDGDERISLCEDWRIQQLETLEQSLNDWDALLRKILQSAYKAEWSGDDLLIEKFVDHFQAIHKEGSFESLSIGRVIFKDPEVILSQVNSCVDLINSIYSLKDISQIVREGMGCTKSFINSINTLKVELQNLLHVKIKNGSDFKSLYDFCKLRTQIKKSMKRGKIEEDALNDCIDSMNALDISDNKGKNKKFSLPITKCNPVFKDNLVTASLIEKICNLFDSKYLMSNMNIHNEPHKYKKLLEDVAKIHFATVTSAVASRSGYTDVFMDEACQTLESSAILAILPRSVMRVVLVGDPNQLPTPIQIQDLEPFMSQSLMERLMKIQCATPFKNEPTAPMLNIQRRCHPRISKIFNTNFYGSSLLDGDNVKSSDRASIALPKSWLAFYSNVLLCHDTSRFPAPSDIPLLDSELRADSASRLNEYEAYLAVGLIRKLMSDCATDIRNGTFKVSSHPTIAIITPYAEQKHLLLTLCNHYQIKRGDKGCDEKHGNVPQSCLVYVLTVDEAQGSEYDIVIISTVRTAKASLGFLEDKRRANVMFSRAKFSEILIGNLSTLVKGPSFWKSIASTFQTCTMNFENYCRGFVPDVELFTKNRETVINTIMHSKKNIKKILRVDNKKRRP